MSTFSLKIVKVLIFVYRSLVQLEFIIVYGVKCASIFFHLENQLSQQNFLSRVFYFFIAV